MTVLTWVALPNRHDGESYTSLITHNQGAILFSAWVLIVQVASRCNPRGVLVRDNKKPHTPLTLSLKTRAPQEWFEITLDYLSKETDWLVIQQVDGETPPSVICPSLAHHPSAEGGNGMEWNGKKGNRERAVAPALPEIPERKSEESRKSEQIRELFDNWNALRGVKHSLLVSDKRRQILKRRFNDLFFCEHWKEAMNKVQASSFCCGENDRNWTAGIEWFMQPDTVLKIMEGRYDNSTNRAKSRENPRNAGLATNATEVGKLHAEHAKKRSQPLPNGVATEVAPT